jgi:hypothetical protein
MFDLDKHREDLIKLIYDLLKIWITLSIISPFVTKNVTIIDLFIGALVSVVFLLFGIILRQGGQNK